MNCHIVIDYDTEKFLGAFTSHDNALLSISLSYSKMEGECEIVSRTMHRTLVKTPKDEILAIKLTPIMSESTHL